MFAYINSRLQLLSSMKQLEQVQAFIIKAGHHNNFPIVSKLIAFAALSPSGSLTHAQAVFEETPMDDPFTCNTMIRAYCKSVCPIKGIYIYNQMQNMSVVPDNYTFNFVLKACAMALWCMQEDANFDHLGISCKASEVHCRVMKAGFDGDEHVQNSLIHLYSQSGLLDHARHVFDEMSERSITSWNIMVSAYDQVNDFESANYLMSLMPTKNVVSYNSLIARLLRLGDTEAANKVFREMPERDSVSWNSMIAGKVQMKDYNGALNLFREMQMANVAATDITLISIIGACAETGALHEGRRIHESFKRIGYKVEGYLGNALVDMYAKCGDLTCAWQVFDELKMKPVSCWNAMIVGLAVHGYFEQSLKLYAKMESKHNEVMPNRITFIGVLVACSHKGLVQEGLEYFRRMIEDYKIRPDMKHYGCMVDLLSRWGLVTEAYQLIQSMPFDASPVVWRTLLGACKVHGNVDLAKESFRQLAKIESLRDADYILLSNIYAEAERWEDVDRLRTEMSANKVPKISGYSHIEVGITRQSLQIDSSSHQGEL